MDLAQQQSQLTQPLQPQEVQPLQQQAPQQRQLQPSQQSQPRQQPLLPRQQLNQQPGGPCPGATRLLADVLADAQPAAADAAGAAAGAAPASAAGAGPGTLRVQPALQDGAQRSLQRTPSEQMRQQGEQLLLADDTPADDGGSNKQRQQAMAQQEGAAPPAGDAALQELFDALDAQLDAGRPPSLSHGAPSLQQHIAGRSTAGADAELAAEVLARAQQVAEQLPPAPRPPG